MVTCAVANCKNNSGKFSKNKNGITFHRFPQDKARRERWEVAVNREENWSSTVSSAVCSEHFDASDFYLTESGLRRLSCEAIPLHNISACQRDLDPKATISEVQPADIKPTDSEEVIKLKYKIRRLEAIAENRKRRLNLMWQRKKRLKKKLEQMKTYVKHLIKHRRKENESNSIDEVR